MSPARTLTVFGESIEILISGEETSGCSTTLIQTSPPGGGPPPHSHSNEDEIFFVIEGDYEFLENGVWSKATPGQAVSGMRGLVHAFRNVGTTAGKMLVFVAPAGLEYFFAEIAPLSMPADRAQILAIAERFGISFQS